MKKYIIILSVIAVGILAYTIIPALTKSGKILTEEKQTAILPKVLFLTTGLSEGNGELSEGVDVAIQSFSKKGAYVRLDNRDVLLQPEILSVYSVMVLPTSIGYHDGDRKYSLTFLSDLEMKNISDWVRNGGLLISEENIGRNTIEGTDRAVKNGELNPESWKLSEVFGIKMRERDMNGFSIEEKDVKIWNGRIKEPITENEWALIPTEIISDKVKVIAEWVNGDERIPAIIKNDFGKGKAILLTSTYLLHPSNDGGVSGVEQIESFYLKALNNFTDTENNVPELGQWPDGRTSAFCISFNSYGETANYESIVNFLRKENLPSTFFIDSSFNEENKKILESDKNIIIQSGLYSRKDFSAAGFSEMTREIIMNEQMFGRKFTGIRFPYYSTNYWGLLYADEKGYIYDSSIGVDHLTNYTGSVIPYNIPVARDSYYKTLDLLEFCPVKNDDIFFFQKSEKREDYTDELQRYDAQLYEKYLLDFFDHAVAKNNGIMVFEGNPAYTGFSEITMQPLKKLCDTLRTKNCWMTSLDEAAGFRNKLKVLTVGISESGKSIKLKINLPEGIIINGLSFRLRTKPLNISANNKYDTKEINGNYYLITDAKNGDEIAIDL